jgi:hypothetical protein
VGSQGSDYRIVVHRIKRGVILGTFVPLRQILKLLPQALSRPRSEFQAMLDASAVILKEVLVTQDCWLMVDQEVNRSVGQDAAQVHGCVFVVSVSKLLKNPLKRGWRQR